MRVARTKKAVSPGYPKILATFLSATAYLTEPRAAFAQENDYRGQLWNVESTMRQGELYGDNDLQHLEHLAFNIINDPNVQVDSDLISRAISDLIEIYSTKRDHQARIILLINILQGRTLPNSSLLIEHDVAPVETSAREQLTQNMQNLRNRIMIYEQTAGRNPLESGFRARLYLNLAEAISWRGQRFINDATAVLDDLARQLPILLDANCGDSTILARYQLIRAELQMRREHSFTPVAGAGASALIDSVWNSHSIDLVTKLIDLQIEGLSYERRTFPDILTLINELLTTERLQQIEALYGPSRRLGFQKYYFHLLQSRANTLQWLGTEDSSNYVLAIETYERILHELRESRHPSSDTPFPPLREQAAAVAERLNFASNLEIANIYHSDWSGRDNGLAIAYYSQRIIDPQIQTIGENIASANFEQREVLAYAYYGRAEAYRFHSPFVHDEYNPQRALRDYRAALRVAQTLNDNPNSQNILLTKIYLGLSYLAIENNSSFAQADLLEAENYHHLAEQSLRHLDTTQPEMVRELALAYDPNLSARVHSGLSFAAMFYSDSNHRTEGQIITAAHVPLYFLPERWRHIMHGTLAEISQFGPDGNRHTAYGGLRLQLDSHFTIDAQVALGSFSPNSVSPEFRFSLTPPIRLDASIWLPFLILEGDAGLNFENTDLNYYRAAALLNGKWTRLPVLSWLSLGVEYSNYPFYVNNNLSHIYAWSLGGHVDARLFAWLGVHGSLAANYFRLESNNPFLIEPWVWDWKGSLGLRFITQPFSFSINASYQVNDYPTIVNQGGGHVIRLPDSQYDLLTVGASFDWQF